MGRKRKARPRWVVAPVVVLGLLAALVAILDRAKSSPPWLPWWAGWLAVALAAALGVFATWWAKPWAERRKAEADREWELVEQLRRHLGRQRELARLGEPAASGLALRVHQAIPLDTPAGRPLPAQPSPRPRWWHWHRAASSASAAALDADLPLFVPREKGEELRTWMRDAAQTGGFLVLVGASAVGKTRLLYEIAREELAEFAVLAPDLGDGALVNKVAESTLRLPRLIVWLDELQRFLDGPYLAPGSTAIKAGALRRLLDAESPVVVLSTIWPEYAAELRRRDEGPGLAQRGPRYPAAADILGESRRKEVSVTSFSGAERELAATMAAQDPRLARGLADRDHNLTEALSGAPELIRRFEQASPGQRAVLLAAVDARRLGVQGPLSPGLLAAASRGHLASAHPDDDWLPPVLAQLVQVDRATAPLIEVDDREHRRVTGYTVADYLLQYARPRRRRELVPAPTWEALLAGIDNPDELGRLALSAADRGLDCYALPLLHRLADAGAGFAREHLAVVLAKRGELEELRRRADAGDGYASRGLVEVLAERGELEELRRRADAGDGYAREHLAGVLAKRGELEELRRRADAGDGYASEGLARLLAEREELEELRRRADAGDVFASRRLARLLAERGELEELRQRAAANDEFARGWLARRRTAAFPSLRLEELRRWADAGDGYAREHLAGVLAERGELGELRRRAAAGDLSASFRLDDLLAERGELEELRRRADAGDGYASEQLAKVLAERGELEELRLEAAAAGSRQARELLAQALAAAGRGAEAERLRRFGFNPDGSTAAS